LGSNIGLLTIGQHFAGARIHRHHRAVAVGEGVHRGALQVGVDADLQVGAGKRGHVVDHAQGAPFDVGLDVLVADLAAQAVLVLALESRLADVGERGVLAVSELFQVVGVEPADVADHVREQLAVGIAAREVGHDVHAGEAMPVHRQARALFLAQAQLQHHRPEAADRLAVGLEGLQFLGREADQLVELDQRELDVLGLVGHHFQPIRRHVVRPAACPFGRRSARARGPPAAA
jgi:hypothetical protein